MEVGHVGAKGKFVEKTSKKLLTDVEAGIALFSKNIIWVLCDHRRPCVDG